MSDKKIFGKCEKQGSNILKKKFKLQVEKRINDFNNVGNFIWEDGKNKTKSLTHLVLHMEKVLQNIKNE